MRCKYRPLEIENRGDSARHVEPEDQPEAIAAAIRQLDGSTSTPVERRLGQI